MTPAGLAIGAIERRALAARSDAEARWQRAVDTRPDDLDAWSTGLLCRGRVTVNFHPDRIDRSGRRVSTGLLTSGRYRSQWVTGISNGGRSAFRGGGRDEWEELLFSGAYASANPARDEFPIYGALDLLFDDHGGSPRFGSSFLVLRPSVLDRTTFCAGDSHAGPADVGTVGAAVCVAAALAEQAVAGRLLGRPLGLDDLMRAAGGGRVQDGAARVLDHYVEAQVHGGVELGRDCDAIVADPSFRGTSTGDELATIAERFDLDLRWHRGSELHVDDVPTDRGGPTMPELARRVARPDGVVDARAIGVVATTVDTSGPMRPDGDPPGSEAQQLKYLWHCVLAHGRDAAG